MRTLRSGKTQRGFSPQLPAIQGAWHVPLTAPVVVLWVSQMLTSQMSHGTVCQMKGAKKEMNGFVWLTFPLFCCLAFEDGCLTCFSIFVEAPYYANSRGIGYWIANLIVE